MFNWVPLDCRNTTTKIKNTKITKREQINVTGYGGYATIYRHLCVVGTTQRLNDLKRVNPFYDRDLTSIYIKKHNFSMGS